MTGVGTRNTAPCVQHRYTIILSIPTKLMGAITDWTPYRECSLCGHLASESGVRDSLWKDAYGIAWIGASNPVAVERVLERRTAEFGANNPAVRAIAGHLAFLRGESIGPEFDDLDAVLINARKMGLHSLI